MQRSIAWYTWCLDDKGKTVKVVAEGLVSDAVEKLQGRLPDFMEHVYYMNKQAAQFQQMKANMEKNRAVMQVDFSENYTITYQDEVQSAHWNAQQVSLYTVVAWAAEEVASYAVISNYMNHDKYAVAYFNGLLIRDLKKRFPTLETIDIFSDGAAQHFKQKYTMCNMSLNEFEHGVRTNWHFFATAHGKGAVDGIGGQVKRVVWNAVKARQAIVTDAESFAKCAQQHTSTCILLVVSEDVEAVKTAFDDKVEGCCSIPQMHKIHCVRSLSKYKVSYSSTSDDCGHELILKHITPVVAEMSENVPEAGDASAVVASDDVGVKFGDWVVVQFAGKKSAKYFVGQVVGLDDKECSGDVTVKFVKKSGKVFLWPAVDDISAVAWKDIVRTLSEPQYDNRGRLVFVDKVDDI